MHHILISNQNKTECLKKFKICFLEVLTICEHKFKIYHSSSHISEVIQISTVYNLD